MTAHDGLLITFSMLAGGCFGWLAAWRQARKLEWHGVKLWKWDKVFDPQAEPEIDNLRQFRHSER